jgi:hypothetical protein
MTEERLVLTELLEKASEGDFLKAVAEAVLQLLMESDVEGVIGAGRYERNGRANDLAQRVTATAAAQERNRSSHGGNEMAEAFE